MCHKMKPDQTNPFYLSIVIPITFDWFLSKKEYCGLIYKKITVKKFLNDLILYQFYEVCFFF